MLVFTVIMTVWHMFLKYSMCNFRCGPLIDLCRGPHVRHTGKIKALKVHKVSLFIFSCTLFYMKVIVGSMLLKLDWISSALFCALDVLQ